MSTPIKIVSSTLTELATIAVASSALRKEIINGENTITFSVRVSDAASAYINATNLVEFDGDYFDIAYYRKEQQGDGKLMITVECEHVSYRLNSPDYNVDYYYKSNTPTSILADILSGTGFSVGTVDFIDSVAFESALYGATAGNEMSRRSVLMQFVDFLGGELDYEGFAISIVAARGSSTPTSVTVGKDVTILSEAVNKREVDQAGNPSVVYTIGLYKGEDVELGDVLAVTYPTLGISTSLRIISKSYDPYNPNNVTVEVGNHTKTIEDAVYALQSQKASLRYVDALQEATSALNQLVANSMGYYTTSVTNPSTGAMITYIHDAATLETSMTIWVLTEAGLAWTNTGWNAGNPSWSYGLTESGNAVLNVLTTLGINADWINAGSINTDLILVGSQTLTEALAGITSDISALSGGGTNYIQNSAWGTYDSPSLYWWNNALTWLVLEKRIDTWTEFEANIATWAIFEAYTW